MDYTGILNEKENQIIELEKKIQNYEERMRRIVGRETELENHILTLNAEIRRKDEIVKNKNDIILAEFAHGQQFKDAWTKVRKNIELARGRNGADFERTLFEGVHIPSSDEIRAESLIKDNATSRSAVGGLQRIRGQLVTLFKELENVLSSPDANQSAIDRVLEGAILGMEGSKLRESLQQGMERVKLEEKYKNLRLSFSSAAGLFKLQLDKLKQLSPGVRFEFDSEIFNILQSEKIETSIIGGVMQV